MEGLTISVDFNSRSQRQTGSSLTEPSKSEEMFFILKGYVEEKLPGVRVIQSSPLPALTYKPTNYLNYTEPELFEVYMFNQLVFSRKKSGRWPDLPTIVTLIRKLIHQKVGIRTFAPEMTTQGFRMKTLPNSKETNFFAQKGNTNHRTQTRITKQRPKKEENETEIHATEICEMERKINNQIADNASNNKEAKAKFVARLISPLKKRTKAVLVPKKDEKKDGKNDAKRPNEDLVAYFPLQLNATFLVRLNQKKLSLGGDLTCLQVKALEPKSENPPTSEDTARGGRGQTFQSMTKRSSLVSKKSANDRHSFSVNSSPMKPKSKRLNTTNPSSSPRRRESTSPTRRVKTQESIRTNKTHHHQDKRYHFDDFVAEGWDSIDTQDSNMLEEYTVEESYNAKQRLKTELSSSRGIISNKINTSQSEIESLIPVESSIQTTNKQTNILKTKLAQIGGEVRTTAEFGSSLSKILHQNTLSDVSGRGFSIKSSKRSSTRYANITESGEIKQGWDQSPQVVESILSNGGKDSVILEPGMNESFYAKKPFFEDSARKSRSQPVKCILNNGKEVVRISQSGGQIKMEELKTLLGKNKFYQNQIVQKEEETTESEVFNFYRKGVPVSEKNILKKSENKSNDIEGNHLGFKGDNNMFLPVY